MFPDCTISQGLVVNAQFVYGAEEAGKTGFDRKSSIW